MDPIPDPDPETLKFITDVNHAPHPRDLALAIKETQRNLFMLRSQLVTFAGPQNEKTRELIRADIRLTEERLNAYLLQQKSLN